MVEQFRLDLCVLMGKALEVSSLSLVYRAFSLKLHAVYGRLAGPLHWFATRFDVPVLVNAAHCKLASVSSKPTPPSRQGYCIKIGQTNWEPQLHFMDLNLIRQPSNFYNRSVFLEVNM